MGSALKVIATIAGGIVLAATGCAADTDEPDSAADTAAGTSPSPTASISPVPSGDAPSETAESPSGHSTPEAKGLELTAPAQTLGRCLPPSVSPLRELAAYAFAGQVTDIRNNQVTIETTRWYVGPGQPPTVTVASPPPALRNLVQAAEFRVGERYLVAANKDRQVLVCGFTAPETPRVKRLYDRAFTR